MPVLTFGRVSTALRSSAPAGTRTKSIGLFCTLRAQLLGIFEAELSRFAGHLAFRDNPVSGRQQKLFSRRSGQTLELIQVKIFQISTRPVRIVQKLHTGRYARIGPEAIV